MSILKPCQSRATPSWVRIPDGTRVQHRYEAYEGVIDGLTEILDGPHRNPDGRTQYRVNVGDATRLRVSEEYLNILLDGQDLVMLGKEKEEYRRYITTLLRSTIPHDRFVKSA